MARRKNQPEAIQIKYDLAERLREVRIDLYGERGGSEMARRLGVPIRTWYNYESGVTVPAEVLLRFLELTGVEPAWLLHGQGERYRTCTAGAALAGPHPTATVEMLLRTALRQLEHDHGDGDARGRIGDGAVGVGHGAVQGAAAVNGRGGPTAPRAVASLGGERAWLEAERQGRCVEVLDDAMAPILAPGARVAFADVEEAYEALEGAMVVVWSMGRPLVRWFRRSGGYGMLRAENPEFSPNIHLIDLAAPPHERMVRRVLWTSTPH